MEHGKLIVFEGMDGVGKSTQLYAVAQRLYDITGQPVRTRHFPTDYSPMGQIINTYLNGSFMCSANAYSVASLFALDRYFSYSDGWSRDYRAGDYILMDRYTTSNFVYQGTRVPQSERAGFIEWVKQYEYETLGLPKPDLVIYLDMPITEADRLLSHRHPKGIGKDKYESDPFYRLACFDNAQRIVESENWQVVQCAYEEDEELGFDAGVRESKSITADIINLIVDSLEIR